MTALPLQARSPAPAFRPRKWQAAAMPRVREHWTSDDDRGALVSVATGGGKTGMGSALAAETLEAGGRVVWLAHREELVTQPLETLRKWWPHLGHLGGIVQADRDAPDARIVYASKDTLRHGRRLEAVLAHGRPDLLVVDEAHRSASPTYQEVIAALRGPGVRMLGLSATPDREDGKDLGRDWRIVYSYSIVEAVRDGVLLPPYAAVVPVPDLDLSRVGGRRDYDEAELGRELLRAHIVEHTVEAMGARHAAEALPYRNRFAELTCRGRGVIVVTATVEQAELTAAALNAAGWRARPISGETPRGDRRALLRGFQAGRIDVLCNAAVLTEGTDLPRASAVVLARPTRSWSLFVQTVGRGLRTAEGKPEQEAFILDLAGATGMHSLIGAPVLVGGEGCSAHPDGVHRYVEWNGTGGACPCGDRVPCLAREGAHEYRDGRCTACGKLQCPDGPGGRHHWIPWEDFSVACAHCEAKVADPLGGMANRRTDAPEPIAWEPLGADVHAAHLEEVGILYRRRVGADRFALLWVRVEDDQPRAPVSLSPEPVDAALAELLASDVARKARAVGGRRGARRWEWQRAVARHDAEAVARRAGVL